MNLTQKKWAEGESRVPPIRSGALPVYLARLAAGWKAVEDGKKIRREFKFKDFKAAVGFVNKVASLAEAEGHHPDIFIFYNRVIIDLWTHAVGGLSEKDFIMAAKIDKL